MSDDLQPGDRVEIVPKTFSKEIENMLIGKIGVVCTVPNGGAYWTLHAKFEGTQRPGGYFGFSRGELRKVES